MLVCISFDAMMPVDGGDLLERKPHANMVELVDRAGKLDACQLVFLSDHGTDGYGVCWRWLNRYTTATQGGRAATLVCRPDGTGGPEIAAWRLREVVRAIRRHPGRLDELRCYDHAVENLRLLNTTRSMVQVARLYLVGTDGVATQWSL